MLPAEERADYLAAIGLAEPGLDRLIRAGYALLDLVDGLLLIVTGLLLTLIGIIFARVGAEFILIVFRINEHLGAIRSQGEQHQ